MMPPCRNWLNVFGLWAESLSDELRRAYFTGDVFGGRHVEGTAADTSGLHKVNAVASAVKVIWEGYSTFMTCVSRKRTFRRSSHF